MREPSTLHRPSARREVGSALLAAIALISVAGALFAFTQRGVPSPSPSSPEISPTPTATNRIGILAGHWQYDGGANCGDGVYEADLTYQIAQQIAPLLSAAGYQVDILAEHDARLESYQADALVALHIDS
ncbi:MAG: N-acetylmuramoyl-L-alanine amidase, partial [Chloroflexi bacterium]|nr:N-acetylmuramoyl-L-alanine amidase [Chloroflexota bacterium]